MKNKRGQFYLLAAMMIIGLLFGLSIVENKISARAEKEGVKKLGSEVKIETGNVIGHSLFSVKQTETLLDEWTDEYANYSLSIEPDAEWAFAFGRNPITIVEVKKESTGAVETNLDTIIENVKRIRTKKTLTLSDNNISIEFNGRIQKFKLENGENFYFILNTKDKTGEYVESG